MLRNRAFCCALLIVCSTAVVAAQKPAVKKKPAGRSETLSCRLGTEDRHARIAVVVVRGKTDSFAYYSKWKPRTCSIYLQRNRDPYSKWADTGDITTVNLERGAFLIEHRPGEYHFIFRDIDRERYCGMDGLLNGSLTIRRGSDQCVLNGDIMVEGTPLGGEQAKRDEEPEPRVSTAPQAIPASAEQPAATTLATPPRPSVEAPTPSPAATAQSLEPALAPARESAPTEITQKVPAAPPPSPIAAEKPAESSPSNPFRSLFRFFTQPSQPEESR